MRRVDKPWGHELVWAESARYVGKILHIHAGHRLSRQYHQVKEETFMVQAGEMDLEVGLAEAMETMHAHIDYMTAGKGLAFREVVTVL